MTVSSTGRLHGQPHDRAARWSLELAAVSVSVFLVLGVLSVWDVRDSGWGSWFVPAAAIFSLAAGITGGAAAVVSMLKGERSKLLFLPIVLAIVCMFVLVGEAFLWE